LETEKIHLFFQGEKGLALSQVIIREVIFRDGGVGDFIPESPGVDEEDGLVIRGACSQPEVQDKLQVAQAVAIPIFPRSFSGEEQGDFADKSRERFLPATILDGQGLKRFRVQLGMGEAGGEPRRE
jgi:hypothetical protein